RHTRFSRDWSSDVCSSDLLANGTQVLVPFSNRLLPLALAVANGVVGSSLRSSISAAVTSDSPEAIFGNQAFFRAALPNFWIGKEIGRASCRETMEYSVGGG